MKSRLSSDCPQHVPLSLKTEWEKGETLQLAQLTSTGYYVENLVRTLRGRVEDLIWKAEISNKISSRPPSAPFFSSLTRWDQSSQCLGSLGALLASYPSRITFLLSSCHWPSESHTHLITNTCAHQIVSPVTGLHTSISSCSLAALYDSVYAVCHSGKVCILVGASPHILDSILLLSTCPLSLTVSRSL